MGVSASVHAVIHTPWADTAQAHNPPPGRHPLQRIPTATAADGTHPTGMLSCFFQSNCILGILLSKCYIIIVITTDLIYHWIVRINKSVPE